jgi:hypothetical protein
MGLRSAAVTQAPDTLHKSAISWQKTHLCCIYGWSIINKEISIRCLSVGVRRISIEDRQHGPLQGSEKVKNRQMVDVPGVMMKGLIIKTDTDMLYSSTGAFIRPCGGVAGENELRF